MSSAIGKLQDWQSDYNRFFGEPASWLGISNDSTTKGLIGGAFLNPAPGSPGGLINSYKVGSDARQAEIEQHNITSIEEDRATQTKLVAANEAEKKDMAEEERKKRLRQSINIYTQGMGDTSKANTKRGVLLGA